MHKSKKRVLFVLPNDQLGGAEGVLRMIAKELCRTGHEIHVFFLSNVKNCGWTEQSGISLHYSKHRSQYGGALTLLSLLIKSEFCFFYSFSSHVYVNGLLGLFKRCQILKTDYLVARESTSIFQRYKGWRLSFYLLFYNLGYPAIDLLICQSKEMKERLISRLPHIAKRIHICHIDNPFTMPLQEVVHDTADQYLIERYQPYIVSAGRLIPEKGFDVLIESFYSLLSIYPNLHLVILGDGYEYIKLKKLVDTLQISSSVHMPGHTANVYPWFRNAKVAVVSSRIEGYPNVLLQMMSQNKNVVSTLCAGGISKLVGVVTAEPNCVTSLTKAISKSLQGSVSNKTCFSDELRKRNVIEYVNQIKLRVGDEI